MTHYIGLDAHSKTCTAVVINAAGKIATSVQFATSERNLLDFIKTVKKPRELAFEEQNLAHWLFLTTSDHVDKLVVAHPAHLPKQRGAKGDFQDAVRLAEELRADRLTSVFHEDSKLWNLRAIVNSYHDFVADLVRSKNRYKAFLRSRGIACAGSAIFADASVLEKITIDYERFAAMNLFAQIRVQQEIKDSYEKKFSDLAKQWPVIRRLGSIPGISDIRGAIITAIICSPARFPNKHKLWAYAKLVRYIDVSDGRIYGSRETAGRRELKAVFMGAATAVLAGSSGLRRYYDRLRTKGTCHNDAKKAVARRVAAISLMIMKTGKTYDDHHEDRRMRAQLATT
jgi:transposase